MMDELCPLISPNMDGKICSWKKIIHEQWVKLWCPFEILFIYNKEFFLKTIVWEIFENLSYGHSKTILKMILKTIPNVIQKLNQFFLTNRYFKFPPSWFQGKGKMKDDECKCIGYLNSGDERV